jgi:DNA-binding ferritin-like protein
MLELYSDIAVLYNKVHTLHIKTVKMPCCATLHPTLGNHYEILEWLVDKVWEDIIQKGLNEEVCWISECIKNATIKDDMIYDDEETIIDDLSKDYDYLIWDIKNKANKEKDLLIQNILLDVRNEMTKLCADIEREKEEIDDKKETKKESKPKMWIKPY